ncbi:MAG TPA: phage portal protein, partial [bacterium]|nr:phage portal protein [bacterium]
KLIPLKDLAEIADKLSRNEIVTSNEFRSFLGLKPSKDPKADSLRNPNIPQPDDGTDPALAGGNAEGTGQLEEDDIVNQAFDDFDAQLGEMLDTANQALGA